MDQKKDIQNILRFINICNKFGWLLKNPVTTILQRLILGNFTLFSREVYYESVIRLIGLTPKKDLEFYREELIANSFLRKKYMQALEQEKIPRKHKSYDDRFSNNANVVNYYALVRELEPEIVVETGTASGAMTSWVLAALEANNKGKLISIDIPPVEGRLTMGMTVSKEEIGFLIPAEYHKKWEYLCGDAKLLLPRVLADNSVDIFIHDSLHTNTHMLFEYNVARCLMKPSSIIMSDDILWNRSFFNFILSHKLYGYGCISNPNLGLTVNKFDDFELREGVGIVEV